MVDSRFSCTPSFPGFRRASVLLLASTSTNLWIINNRNGLMFYNNFLNVCVCAEIYLWMSWGRVCHSPTVKYGGNFVHLFLATFMQVSRTWTPIAKSCVASTFTYRAASPAPHRYFNHAPYVMRATKEHLESLEKILGRWIDSFYISVNQKFCFLEASIWKCHGKFEVGHFQISGVDFCS